MKRLLAYLFIVLGLGLTFNVNADAKELQICLNHLSKDNIQVIRYKYSLGPNNYGCRSIFKSDAPKLYKKIIKSYSKTKLKFGGKKIYSLKKKILKIF